jgi:hypothetical protein
MADHNVALHYFPTGHSAPHGFGFAPNAGRLKVKQDETISFRVAPGTPDGKILVTFQDKQFFSSANPQFSVTGQYRAGDPDVRATALPPQTVTKYDCALLDDAGNPLAKSNSTPGEPSIAGGEIILDRP